MLKQFNSNARKLNRIIPKINPNNLVSTDLTGSLANIEIPNNTKFESKTRSNSNPIKSCKTAGLNTLQFLQYHLINQKWGGITYKITKPSMVYITLMRI